MKRSAENQLKKVIGLLAGAIALLIVLVLPSTYYYVQYQHLSSSLQYKADILANDVSIYAFQHPDTWSYEEQRLIGFLERNLDLEKEKAGLFSGEFEVSISSGKIESPPSLIRRADINDGINRVGLVNVQSSLYPVLSRTFYSFILSLLLGGLIFATLYYWPMNVLALAIHRLDDARKRLEDKVVENSKLLKESETLSETLKSQRDFTNTVFEVANNVIVVLDVNGNIVRFNRSAEEISGYKRDEVLGKPVWDCVIPEENRLVVKDTLANIGKGDASIVEHYEGEWLTHEGGRRVMDCSKSALYDQAGEVSHIVILGYDITQRKESEEQERRLQRELNQARKMEALGQLTGGIAHDFNNMLGIIIGYSDLALSQLKSSEHPSLKKYLDNISQSGKRASELVKQMMVFSRKDAGHSEVVSFAVVAEESIKMLRSVLPSSISINVESEENLPSIKIDSVQLQQIMMNLCLNAKDAMDGEGTLDIKLGWHRNVGAECMACHKHIDGDWLELSVADTGCGMSTDVLDRIFEPFYTTKEVGKGTGLGLSMTHSLIDSHHGHILVETQVGRGTTFKLLFPPFIDQPDANEKKREEKTVLLDYTGQGEKILVVDDESSLASFVDNLLSGSGYQCVTRSSSIKALEVFSSAPTQFAMLITDQTMPALTGMGLIAEVRKYNPDLPVILMTGYSDTVNKEEANRQGIAYINKPFNSEDLLSCVANSLKRLKS